MSKTVLVTGAAGFIGSHAADALLARGDRVVGLDNLNPYYDPARKRANVEEVRAASSDDAFTFVEGDIRDVDLLEKLFSTHGFDSVVHLAAMAGVRASMDDPAEYIDVNLMGTLRLLEQARDKEVKTFAFASTSSVYGNTDVIPFIETDRCDRPLAPYPASKRSAELLGHSFHHLYQTPFTALRFFTVYGPRGRPDMMAYKVLDNIYTGVEVPLYNDGQMHRDWTYVADIVQGIVGAVDHPVGYEPINLGRGEPTLLADFIAQIEGLAGKKSNLTPMPMMDADVKYTNANVDKARELLGYDPKISVDEGVRRFFDWYAEAVRDAG